MNKKSIVKVVLVVSVVVLILFVGGLISNKLASNFNNDFKELLANRDLSSSYYEIKNSLIINEDGEKIYTSDLVGISTGYIYINSENEFMFSVFNNGYCHTKEIDSDKVVTGFGSCSERVYSYDYTGSEQVFVTPVSGYYNIELWGAGGGHHYVDNRNEDWKEYVYDLVSAGAYTSGEIYLEKGELLYVYVGGQGEDGQSIEDVNRITHFGATSKAGIGGYNGGGDGMDDPDGQASGGGGGATDIRLVDGSSDSFESLKSRLMVAAGGAGMGRIFHNYAEVYYEAGIGGDGGTLSGIDAIGRSLDSENYSLGSTQTDGYKLGIGENGEFTMNIISAIGGGAGGYYGSITGWTNVGWYPPFAPGGGSSFVSGCEGCNAIAENSTEDNIVHTDQSIHYSNKSFSYIEMIAGNEKMPDYNSSGSIEGNTTDGYARISFMGVR